MTESWWQIRFEVPAELAGAVAWLLAEDLDLPVEVQDTTTLDKGTAETSNIVVGLPQAPPLDLDARVGDCLARLGLPPVDVQTRRRDDTDWRDGWRAFFRGVRLSDRVAVHPPWEKPPKGVPAAVIIDPGLAFGTGTHETTRGVMRALDRVLAARFADAPTTLLDVGSGSAILSIAAAKLGHRAIGVEIDPVAVRNARANVERNRVGDDVELVEGSADAIVGRFDLVVANILATILIDIAESIIARCAPGGALILSGLLAPQRDAVLAAYPGFDLAAETTEGEWVILELVRDPAAP